MEESVSIYVYKRKCLYMRVIISYTHLNTLSHTHTHTHTHTQTHISMNVYMWVTLYTQVHIKWQPFEIAPPRF